jgi:hypothetical protein
MEWERSIMFRKDEKKPASAGFQLSVLVKNH